MVPVLPSPVKVWPAPGAKVLVNAETSKVAPEPINKFVLSAMLPGPLKASVPAAMVVLPR